MRVVSRIGQFLKVGAIVAAVGGLLSCAGPVTEVRPTDQPETVTPESVVAPVVQAPGPAGGAYPEWLTNSLGENGISNIEPIAEQQNALIEQVNANPDWFGVMPGNEMGALQWKFFVENPDDPNSGVKVCLENIGLEGHGYPVGALFTFSENGEPVQMNTDEYNVVWDWARDAFVRRAVDGGDILAVLNEVSGQWEKVVVPVEEAVEIPTEESTIPMEVSHTYTGEVMGVPVQYTIGLHPGLVNASEFPIKNVVTNDDVLFPHHITGEQISAKQLLAELVMRSHWKGWQEDDIARGGTTFEQYMELVKQGGGKYMVSGTVDDTSLSLRERDVIQELEVDPQLPITVVLSNRADPLVSFVSDAGFRIAQKSNREMIIEMTFKTTRRENYYGDSFMLGYNATNTFSSAMQVLHFSPEMQEKNTGLIGGLISFDPNVRDFMMMPQGEIQQPILKAITN